MFYAVHAHRQNPSDPSVFNRNLEADVAFRSTAAVYSYCRSRGLYAGVSLVGSYLVERKETNRKYVLLNIYHQLALNLVFDITLYTLFFCKMFITCFLEGSMAKTFVHLPFSMVMWSHLQKPTTCMPFWRTTLKNTPLNGRANIWILIGRSVFLS